MRAEKYLTQIPDLDYWKGQIKCQQACPVRTDARGYVRAISEGLYEKAYMIARGPNPLASICGRICGAPCEAACRRSDFDEAVHIRALKRFVTERFGPESDSFGEDPLELVKRYKDVGEGTCDGPEEIKWYLRHFKNPRLTESSPTVGIIGSGPAGLAAAHDLSLMGIRPIVYEAERVPGGMLYLGVPEYRLPRELVKAEIEVIKALGTVFNCNCEVGRDLSFSEIHARHNAVLIAVGTRRSKRIPIPNAHAPGVEGGVDFLRAMALRRPPSLEGKVLVIGGGNVAYDVARTVLRQTEYDVSRTALRQKGVEEVHLVCLESLEEMPADTEEIQQGEEEGVIRHNSWGPKEILVNESGKVCGVSFTRCLSVFDQVGRFTPRYDHSQTMTLPADHVFLCVGQESDLGFLEGSGIPLEKEGRLALDSSCRVKGVEGVFAAGDVAHGPKLMIDAIASGKEVARKIYTYLKKENFLMDTQGTHSLIRDYQREWGFETFPRDLVEVVSPEGRKKAVDRVIERGFSEAQARRQANRCLDCGVNTIFDSGKCVLCGGCADVCPQSCLKLVSFDNLIGNKDLDRLLTACFGEDSGVEAGAIIKDETLCIRCGLCAERCPVGAISMERFSFKEVWIRE